jgi:hypothetical protein
MIAVERENRDLFSGPGFFLKKPDPDPDLTVLFQRFRYNTYSPLYLALA